MTQLFGFLFSISLAFQGSNCIMGGHLAYQGQFKYTASIWEDVYPSCTGGIIDEYHILTAGHCVHGTSKEHFRVVVGIVSFIDEKVKFLSLNRIIVHPEFKRVSSADGDGRAYCKHDLAVLRLKRPLQWNLFVQPVPLMTTNSICLCCVCAVTGWGMVHPKSMMSAELKWTSVFLLRDEICWKTGVFLTDNEMCAFDPRGTTLIGRGDSGSLLVCNGVAVGVLSSATDIGHSTYRMIHAYAGFIDDAVHGRI